MDITYSDMSRKEWLLRRHPNITGWLIVAFRYVVYHRIRAWYREQRILERYKNEQRASRAIDPFAEAMLLTEAEDIMVAAIGARRYALLRAYRYDGVPVKDLAERTGIPEAEWRDTWNAVGQPAQTWEVINTQETASLLQEHGYDGIVAREGDTRTYAVFDPGQVKSAVANRGTFNRENPDIRFSVDEETDQEYNALEKSEGVILGDQDETYTEGNTPVQFTYAIVPAEALVVSNDEYGSVNPAYPAELQPRDRSRTASQVQIQEMSRNLNPRLLADSPTAQNGALSFEGTAR